MDSMNAGTPLNISTDARLELAVDRGWQVWIAAARTRNIEQIATWLSNRIGGEITSDDLAESLRELVESTEPGARAHAAADLAELVEEEDAAFGIVLWEAVLEAGKETGDGELVYEGASRLASIEERFGDPLTAAEMFVDFLNWRRQDDHASDPESVLTAFDEIIRFAQEDGATEAVARFEYEQARFMRLVEAESPLSESGDWLADVLPFTAWDDD